MQTLSNEAKPGSIAGACKHSTWASNSFKADRLCESLDCVPDSLLVTDAKQSPRLLARPCGAMKMAKPCKEGMAAN